MSIIRVLTLSAAKASKVLAVLDESKETNRFDALTSLNVKPKALTR